MSCSAIRLTYIAGYEPVAHESKPHGRIIWDCTWAPEGDVFVTASRDKTVCFGSSKDSSVLTLICAR